MRQRKKLLEMICDQEKLIQVVGAHNGLSAKLVEMNGFDAIWASGFEISAAYAKPDANILTMTQFLDAAKQMVESSELPIIADCDTGFGNINNVIHMVKEYERMGIAAVCIEDKEFPKVNSFIPGRQILAPIEEFCSKIMAAKETQQDPDFIVIARTEALIAGQGMEEALIRARAYEKAGADMILIHSKLKEPTEILEFIGKWNGSKPIVIVPTTYPTMTIDEMKDNNIKMVIYANQGLRSAVKAMNETLQKLKHSDSLFEISNSLAPMEFLFELQGMNEMISKERELKQRGEKSRSELVLTQM